MSKNIFHVHGIVRKTYITDILFNLNRLVKTFPQIMSFQVKIKLFEVKYQINFTGTNKGLLLYNLWSQRT